MSVPLARRNLFHEKGKLALSVLGMAASLALILLLMGFRRGLYATLTAYVDNIGADLIVAQSGVQGMFSSNSAVPLNIHNDMTQAADAVEAGHILLADVIFTHRESKTPVVLVGYDPETNFGSPWKMGTGRAVETNEEIALDTWLARRAGIEVGDKIELLGRGFIVVGLTRETASWMSPYIFITLDAAESALGLTGIVSYHLLRIPEKVDIRAVAKIVESQIPGIEVLTPEEIATADRRVLATIMDTPINVMLTISIVIGLAVMGLTTYTAITDHKREYGVLKAVGAGKWQMTRMVTMETSYRAIIGFLLSTALSYLAAELIMLVWPQFLIVIHTKDVAIAGALAAGMALVASSLPIRRLNQIDPLIVFKS